MISTICSHAARRLSLVAGVCVVSCVALTGSASAHFAPGILESNGEGSDLMTAADDVRSIEGVIQTYLDGLAETIAEDEHVLLVLDQAGWHLANDLRVPPNITLEPLPPRSPELNPVERLWLFLKQRYLSHRLLEDYAAILEAACSAWQRLIADTGRLTSLCFGSATTSAATNFCNKTIIGTAN